MFWITPNGPYRAPLDLPCLRHGCGSSRTIRNGCENEKKNREPETPFIKTVTCRMEEEMLKERNR